MQLMDILQTDFYSITAICCFLMQLLIAEFLFFHKFEKRNHFILRVIAGGILFCFLGILLPVWIANYISGVRTFCVLVMAQFYMMFCYRQSFWDVLFCNTGAFILQNLGSNIQVFICGILESEFRMTGIEMVICYFFTYVVGYFLFARKVADFPDISKRRGGILALALSSLCVGWVLQSWMIEEKYDLIPVCRAPFIFCCVITLFVQFGFLENSRLDNERETLEQLLKENEKQYDLSRKTIEIINMKCHDLKHRILDLENRGNLDTQQLAEISQAIDIYDGLAKTGCKPLDIILSEKNLLCEKYQIKFSYMIDGEKLAGIKAGDLAAIFGNALDNAIEYVETLPVEKRIISLIGYARKDVMGIHMENYCEKELKFQDGLPVSTKGNMDYHGFGLKSVRYVVEKYGGNLVIGLENQIFSMDIIFPVL